MYVHLNTHSVYSAMRGLLSLSDLVSLAKNRNMDTLALTDINGLWGFIKFVQCCKEADIYPIAGAHLITGTDEAIILVENQHGYQNLCRLLSNIHKQPNEGLIVNLGSNINGLFILSHKLSTLYSLKPTIPDSHLFVELCPGLEETKVHSISEKLGLEIIATGDVYLRNPNDHNAHVTLRAIYNNTTINNLDPKEFKTDQHWFRSEQEMIKLFPNSLDAIRNSRYLADRCKKEWSFINTIFPGISLQDSYKYNQILKNKVYSGAKKRYKTLTDIINHRIEYELNLINQKRFASYFLIVEDIISQTRATIGRGSAAASIVSYCLFITQVDPIRYMLQFERFIHPEREDMPDIDVDFPWDERDSVLKYVFDTYGKDKTAMVSNHVFLKSRSAIREVGKVYGLSNEEINTITKRISFHPTKSNLEYLVQSDFRFAGIDFNDELFNVVKYSEKVIGALRYLSVHPGGVIIVPDEICKYVPVLKAAKGVQIVQWEKDQVEDSGLLKIDLLGNRSLAVVRDTIRQINLNYGESASDSKYIDYHQIQPVNDEKTSQLLKAGKTMGVFYIESPAARQLLAKARVVDFKHIVIYSSIIRPAANHYVNMLLDRVRGKKWLKIHPDLNFLDESYGIMVYEEQVSNAAMVMAGFSYSDAEKLRKVISRNSKASSLSFWKNKFMLGALRRGYSIGIIKKVWAMISSFVGYAFCKPHSASYAMLSFTCAYLKAHFKAEFIASVISNGGGYYSSYAYMSEARRLGIQILQPDINLSHYHWKGWKNKIRMGFMSIKKLQQKTIEHVINERKKKDFHSLEDFLKRVTIDLSDAIVLTNAGCFRNIAPEMNHQEIAYYVAGFCIQNSNQIFLADSPIKNKLTNEDKYRLELEVFGYPVSVHPLSKYRPLLSNRIKYAKDISRFSGYPIYLIGLYIAHKEILTNANRPMKFLTLEDESDIYECIIFPETFRKYGDILYWEKLFILKGIIEQSFGIYTVKIEKLASLQQWVYDRYKKKY